MTSPRRILVLALASLAPLGAPVPARAGGAPPARPAGGEEALRIRWDGATHVVTRDELAAWICAWRGEYVARDYARSQRIARAAEAAGVRVDDAAVDSALDAQISERLDGAFGGEREAWLDELERTGRSEAGFRAMRREQIRDELRVLALAAEQRVQDPEALRRVFELRHGRAGRRFELDLVRVRVLVRAGEQAAPEERARAEEIARRAAYETARKASEEARAGADFAELARRYSDDPATRDAGGRLEGLFEPRFWPEPALDALAALEVGRVSDPIFARGAWWVMRARRVQVTALEDVRAELEGELSRMLPSTDEVERFADALGDAETLAVLPALWNPEGGPADEPVLRLGERTVTRAEFVAYVMPLRAEGLVPAFLEHWWAGANARRAGVEVADDEVEARIADDLARKLRDLYAGSREKWRKELERQGRSEDSYYREQRLDARDDLLADRVLVRERTVTEADLRRAWEARYGRDGRRLEVRMLSKRLELPVFHTEIPRERYDEIVRRKKDEVRGALNALRVRALAGEGFAALARAESDDVETQPSGGAFPGGWRDGRFPVELVDALRALPIGSISEPLEITEAFAIFLVESEERVPFESVRAELEAALRAQPPTAAERAAWINLGLGRLEVERRPGLYR